MRNKIKFHTSYSKYVLIIVLFLAFIPSKAGAVVNSQALVDLTNSTRAQQGLATLSVNSQLVQAASLKAQDMLTKDYFAHTSPEGLNSWHWFKKVGYDYKTAGENLAIDFTSSSTVFSAWMASPSHKANIIDSDFAEIGIASASGEFSGSNTTVVVQMFGAKVGQKVAPQKSTSDLSWNIKSFSGSFQKRDNVNIWDGFLEKFKAFWSDTSEKFKNILVKEVFLV